ncbi:helix-turn-helix transcriptional regulator [Lapillicoccus sp.]|uniref:helix-turn-helix domain-containing protein n=1 Tax=Lapillicoccus sp. TaxID=1909287 RepID=UPI0025DFAFB5|nr:helix-turn-helix transcriptional regulator [Lapillicoccus sp.]
MTTGESFRHLRRQRGLRQVDIATRAGCSARTVSRLEADGPTYWRILAACVLAVLEPVAR